MAEQRNTLKMLRAILLEIRLPDGAAATEQFSSLREVESKVREARLLISETTGLSTRVLDDFNDDQDFLANSRRVRLEALAGHIDTVVRLIEGGLVQNKKPVVRAPDVTALTSSTPELKVIIDRRWIEAQKCRYIGCYTPSIIMMGSVLEALLLSRALMSPSIAYQSVRAPKDRNGKPPALQDWKLTNLIDVAVDVGWLKVDRGKFSHALRESRNVVHPWQEMMLKADFDEATCRTSWEVLKASIDDLLISI